MRIAQRMMWSVCVFLLPTAIVAQEQAEKPDPGQRWYMNEEWYDWHLSAEFDSDEQGVVRTEVHFVGPGAVTPRGIYVRGDAGQALDNIVVQAIKDHHGNLLKSEPYAVQAVGTPEGKKWVCLAKGAFRRGFEPLELVLNGAKFDHVCVSPNERYITHGRAERYISDTEKGKEVRCGMPMGGIGAGKVEIARDGWFRNITTNNNIDAPIHHPDDCFMAASINGHARILRDEPTRGLPSVGRIDFDARYPIAKMTFADDDWPIQLQLTAWSPIVPRDIDDSSLPAAAFHFVISNTTPGKLNAAVALSWENLVGFTGRPQPSGKWGSTGHYMRYRDPTGNEQKHFSDQLLYGAMLYGGQKGEPDAEGQFVIATTRPGGLGQYHPSVAVQADDKAWKTFIERARFDDEQGEVGQDAPAALAISVTLEPGESVTIPIVLAWYMDHFYQLGTEDLGHYYHNGFDSALDVARFVLFTRDSLLKRTRRLHEDFDRSDLPDWIADMLLNDLYVLSTDTWLTRDGRFSVNEGATNMYGVMGTMDQKLYASHHLALLFPELQMQELRQFGELQNDNGGITHDLGTGEFAPNVKAFDWPDLCSAFVILSHQVYRYTADRAFWDDQKPRVLKAVEALATVWDPDNVGVPGNGSTFDDEDSYRIFSYTTGLYMTVLKIARGIGGEDTAAEYQQRYSRAHQLAMDELWTGDYFRYGATPAMNKRTEASHFSQLAGEFWARLLGVPGNYKTDIRQEAMASLFRMHCNDNFKLPPKIVQPDGTLFPRDGEHRNAPVSWPMHSRAMIAGNGFFFGMERQAWDLLKHMRDNAMAANGPDPWDQSLYWDPITAQIDWGIFYMTAPASWLAYQALIDTAYDAIDEQLTLRPVALAKLSPGKFPILMPLFDAMGSVNKDLTEITVTFERLPRGQIVFTSLRLPDGVTDAEVTFNNKAVSGRLRGDTLTLDMPLKIDEPGRTLAIEMK